MYVSARQKLKMSLEGGRSPRSAGLAIVLGTTAGFAAGWNLTTAALLLVFAALNLRTRLFAAAFCVGAATAALASGLTYRIGYFLLDETPLGAVVGFLGDSVFVSLLDWDRYTLVGGASLGLLLSLPAAKLAAKFAAASSAPEEDAPREAWLRAYGVVWSLAVMAACGLTAKTLGSKLVERELLSQLAAANGAPVEAAAVRYSLWTGELEIDDLQLVDPDRLDRDRLHIGRLAAVVTPGALLRDRFATDRLLVSQVRTDVARRQAAASAEGRASRAPEFRARAVRFDASGNELELDGYLRQWPEFRERLAWLGRLSAALEQLGELEKQTSAAAPYGERSQLGRPTPRLQIAFVRADELPDGWGLGGEATLELTRLTSRPELSQAGARLKIVAPAFDAQFTAELELAERQPRHRVNASLYNCRLADLVDSSVTDRSVVIARGKADVQIEGWINAERCELTLHVEAKSLDAHFDAASRPAGLEAAVWNQGLERLRALRADASLAGDWTSPALTVDRQRLVDQFKHQLRAAGEHELVHAIEQQVASPPAAEATPELSVAVEPAEPEGDFFTISDEAPSAATENSPDGWHRAKSATAGVSHGVGQDSSPVVSYPKTNAPDSDPADRLLARLGKPAAGQTSDASRPAAERVARNEAERLARHESPSTASAAPRSPKDNRPLPGPINLVVGQYDRSAGPAEERPQWPRTDAELPDEFAEPAPQPGALARMANNARDAFRRILPRRKPPVEYDLPPDLPDETEIPELPELGPEEPIDEALEQRPPQRQSLIKRWFR